MVFETNGTICGLPSWIGITRNDTAAYINDILLATVNGPCAIFAFFSNLAIIVTVIKNPALQKPCNILLCSLAFADCLTGLTAQPMFVAWRFFLQRAQQSCSHQVMVFDLYYTFNVFTVGLSFVNVLVISFDRHYASSSPLVYIANATKTGAIKVATLANIIWLLFSMLVQFVLPPFSAYVAVLISGVMFVVVPIVNYIRMLIAIRRHNSELGDAVSSQQTSVLLRREKRVALDMCIVAIFLLASLAPGMSVKIVELRYPRVHSNVLPWSLTMAFLPSSFNPLIYVGRNKNLRKALKSMMNIPL